MRWFSRSWPLFQVSPQDQKPKNCVGAAGLLPACFAGRVGTEIEAFVTR